MPHCDTDQGSPPSPINRSNEDPDKRFRQGFLGPPAAVEEEQVTDCFVPLIPDYKGKVVPYMGWGGRGVSESDCRDVLGGLLVLR